MSHIEPITREHIAAFVPTLEGFEAEDLAVATHGDPVNAVWNLSRGCRYTFAGVADDGGVLFIGGVYPATMQAGHVWMLGAPGIAHARKFYLRSTREQVAHMRNLFPILRTYVDERYARSLRWLEWLGFSIGSPVALEGRNVRLVELKR